MASEPSPERSLLRSALGPGKDCPPLEKLEICLRAAIPEEMSRHLESCAYCRVELDLLRSFESAPRDPEEMEAVRQVTERLQSPRALAPRIRGSRWKGWKEIFQIRWLSPAAFAVAALLILAAIGLQWRHSLAPGLYAPTRAEDNVMRSGRLTLIAPAGDLELVPSHIQWQPVPGAVKYRVRLLEVDHSEVWTASTPDLQVEIPAQVRSRIVAAKPFLLQISALDGAGRTLGESELARFRFLPKIHNR